MIILSLLLSWLFDEFYPVRYHVMVFWHFVNNLFVEEIVSLEFSVSIDGMQEVGHIGHRKKALELNS